MINNISYKEKINQLIKNYKYSTKLAQTLGVSRISIVNWKDDDSKINETNKLKIDSLYTKDIIIPSLTKEEAEKEVKKVMKIDFSIYLNDFDYMQEVIKYNSFGSYEIEVQNSNQDTFFNILENNYIEKDIQKREIIEINNLASLTKKIINDTIKGNLKELNTNIIKSWHLALFLGIREDAGEYSQYIRKIKDVNLTLTLPEDIEEEMEYWIKLYKNTSNLYDIAKAHEHFELIHPFGDGNGRIGRLIIVHQCIKLNLLPPIINKYNKTLYYNTLNLAQTKGDILPLTWFFAKYIISKIMV